MGITTDEVKKFDDDGFPNADYLKSLSGDDHVWVELLRPPMVEYKRTDTGRSVTVPTRLALLKYGEVRGRIGGFQGTWKTATSVLI